MQLGKLRVHLRVFMFFALPTSLLLVAAGCHRSQGGSPPISLESDASFVGNDACQPCHQKEYSAHHLSFHDVSVHEANPVSLGNLKPDPGTIPLAGYALEQSGDIMAVSRKSTGTSQPESQKLDLALGSGKLGMTYISLSSSSLMETRMSYFPPYKTWDLTPGQEVHIDTDTPFGRAHTESESRNCLGCHTTTLPLKGIRPDRKFFGIGCEACHGAGKPHIDAVRSGKTADLRMEDLSLRTPTHLNELCGKCHRNTSNVALDTPEVNLTHRFQSYALQRSSCRTKSGEPLSCLYCHDPHTNVSTNLSRYEAVCLTCHGGSGSQHDKLTPPQSLLSNASASKTCPVNAHSGCVDCHMRPKVVFPLTSVPAKMADHLISPPGADKARVVPRISSPGGQIQ